MTLRPTIVLPILAVIGIGFALWTVLRGSRPVPAAQPVADPTHPSQPASLSGAGIVESASEEISIASPVAGVIAEVMAKPGAEVQANEALLRLDDRAQRAQMTVADAQVASAQAQLDRLKAQPRSEDLAVAAAELAAATTAREEAAAAWAFYDGLTSEVSAEQRLRSRYGLEKAKAAETEAQRSLDRVKAGAWLADLAVAQAQLQAAVAGRSAAQVELDRLVIRSPIAATILQVKARPGMFAPAGQTSSLVLLGDTRILHVRVDIDENEAWRMRPGASAEGCVRGNPQLRTALRFVRIEPYVIAKKSLTNDPTERVDTRVLQCLFAFDRAALPVYVGQQMDVFIGEPPR